MKSLTSYQILLNGVGGGFAVKFPWDVFKYSITIFKYSVMKTIFAFLLLVNNLL